MDNQPCKAPMFTIQKTSYGLSRQRLTIKAFEQSQDMHMFLNKQPANWWSVCEANKGLKAGVYAYTGGQWKNVKSLSSSILALI